MKIKLGSIVDIQSGYPFKSKDFSTYGIPVVKIKNIKNSKVVFDSNTSYVSNSILIKASNWKLLYGDILITMTGSNTAHPKSMVGDVAKVDSTSEMLLNQRVGRIKVIRPDVVSLDYIYYYLNQKSIHYHLASISSGSANQANLSKSTILSLEVSIPDLGYQQRVVSILNAIDEKIKLNEQINKNLLRLMSIQWKQLFGSLNVKNGYFTDLATITAGGTPSKKNDDYFGGDISWITPKDMSLTNDVFIERGALNITASGLKYSSAKILPRGTLLFSSRAPIGYLGIAANPVTTNQGFKSLVPKRDENTEYLYFLLINLTSYIKEIAGGSTFKEISGAGMKSVEFPLPTNKQIDTFHNQVVPMFDLVKNNERQNKNLTKLRNLLLPKLLAGEIDLSNIKERMKNA
ncbi:restriction endonuclease subunit S [Levilactobacillus brevis]|uniref:Restriction endonuclease subunit S n=1 Tax=Levilactobacillus brevis TaxID=1580 RepID=A0AA41EPX3_LEVBR|nr:restriction endonuclease subunit S [Levilactobacillus brevis]MBS0947607.1 restriction endonuclease subunit S [Levilactobacillus brevis]MBS1010752.1 restriction endonuclease subunit S [Levilactobacillus brevis]